MKATRLLEELLQDLRYGKRLLARNPLVTLVAIVTLALGIGANTAIFSVVNAFLLRPLPYGDANRLVMVDTAPRSIDGSFVRRL
jgi:putative ABC transport system permease protein